jgi:hypothetical protein
MRDANEERMTANLERIWEGKRETRRKLAALPFSEKVKLLEKLRDRTLEIRSKAVNRQTTRKP